MSTDIAQTIVAVMALILAAVSAYIAKQALDAQKRMGEEQIKLQDAQVKLQNYANTIEAATQKLQQDSNRLQEESNQMQERLQTIANDLQRENNELQVEMKKLTYGQMDFQMTEQMSNAKNRLEDVGIKLTELKQTCKDNPAEIEQLSLKTIKSALENYLNIYDSACALYRDGKIDKDRFRKNYLNEVKRVMEAPTFKEYFTAYTTPYQNIVEVHKEFHWHA